MTVLSKIKGLIFYQPNWEQLEKLDKPCPSCKQDTLYAEEGRLVAVHRCQNCRFEGATRQ